MKNQNKIWEEWMGYTVHYFHDENEFIDQSTSYGVSKSRANKKMLQILSDGQCAWLRKVDPHTIEDIPF